MTAALHAALLDVELALKGTRKAVSFVAVASLSGFIGVVVLLAGVVAPQVASSRATTVAESYLVAATDAQGSALVQRSNDLFKDHSVRLYRVGSVSGEGPELPPGVTALPQPGQLVVSPAAAELLERDDAFAERYQGQVSGIVTDAGLQGPHELVVWLGVEGSDVGANAIRVGSFGEDSADLFAGARALEALVPILITGFMLPVATLFFESSHIGARQREVRLAALRLVGAPIRRLRRIASLETLIATVPGVVAAALCFGPLSRALGPHVPINGGIWPGDLTASIPAKVVTSGAVLIFGSAVAWWSLRRLDRDALGVTRGAPQTEASWRRLTVLMLGLVLLAASALLRLLPGIGITASGIALLGAVVCVVAGLIRGLPTVVHMVARLIEARSVPWTVELSAAKARFAPVAISRVATGSMVLVFISGLFLSLIPSTASGNATAWRALLSEQSHRLLIASAQTLPPQGQLESVETYATVSRTLADLGEGNIVAIAVVDCEPLRELTQVPTMCTPHGALVGDNLDGDLTQATFVTEVEESDGTVGYSPAALTLAASSLEATSEADLQRFSPLIGPVAAVIDASTLTGDTTLLEPISVVALPGGDVEAARTSLISAAHSPDVRTVAELISESERTTTMLRTVAQTIVGTLALVAAAIIAATLIGHVRSERRAFAALWRVGAPVAAMRNALVLGVLIAVLPGLVAALPLGLTVAEIFASLDGDQTYLVPWREMSVLAAAALAIPLASAWLVSHTIRPSASTTAGDV